MYKYGQNAGFSTPTTGSDAGSSAVASASRALFVQGAKLRHSIGAQGHTQQPQKHAQPCPPWPHEPSEAAWACSPPLFSDLTREDLQELWRYTTSVPTLSELLPKDLPKGCESEVEQQQLLSLANMLQARALQSRPNAPHRYSLTPAQLQSLHPHPTPTPVGSPVTDRAPSQAGEQSSISPSTSHPGAISHSHGQHAMSPSSTCCVQQPGAPTVLKQQCQDACAPAADLAAQGTQANQVCCDGGQSSGPYPIPSDKAGQASQQSWGREVHAADRGRSSSLPYAQLFRPAVSRLGPLCRPRSTAQPVLSYHSPKVGGRGTSQSCDHHPGCNLGANQPHGPKPGSNQPYSYRASQVQPRQPRQSVRLGLKRKLAVGPSRSANDSAFGHGSQPYDISASDPGHFEKENDPTSALGPHVGTSGSPALLPMSFSDATGSPMLSSAPNSTSSTVAISHDTARSNHCLSAESAAVDTEAGKDIDLLADPTDGLMLSPDLEDNQDNQTGPAGFLLGSHHELPEDPLEGLCVPSWQELLDEAVSHFTPEGPLRSHPVNPGVIPNACQDAQGSLEGCSWDFPALSESPAKKRRKPGDSGATQGATRSLNWDHLQDQRQISSTGSQRSKACDMAASYTLEKSESAVQLADGQTKAHTPPEEQGIRSDTLNQELQQMMMEEISSAVEAQQAKQVPLQPKAAAIQRRRGGPAKHAKRAGASCRGQGKRTAASQLQDRGKAPAPGQGQEHHLGQGQGQRRQGASLGKLLPFDSLQGRTGGKVAELNSRIQATAAQPRPAMKDLPPPSKPLSAVARRVTTLSSAQNSAPLYSVSESPRHTTLVVSQGMLRLQPSSGDEGSQPTVRYTSSCNTATGGGAVQLFKLSGTTSVGL